MVYRVYMGYMRLYGVYRVYGTDKIDEKIMYTTYTILLYTLYYNSTIYTYTVNLKKRVGQRQREG